VSENYCWRSGGELHCCAKEMVVRHDILLLVFCVLLSSVSEIVKKDKTD
jgi:hypothetical protein